MKKLILAALLGVAAIGGGAAAWVMDKPVAADPVEAPLELTGPVVDDAHVLDAATTASLTQRLETLERTAGPQLVVVTTPSLGGREINDYSLALGRGWGIGDKLRNDGVLLVVAPTERKVRIEVGKGLEKTLPDDLCATIIREDLTPRFRQGDLSGGIVAGVDRLSAILAAHPTLPGAKA